MNDLPAESNGSDTPQNTEHPIEKRPIILDSADDKERTPQARKYYRARKLRNAPIYIEAACAIALVIITGFYTHYAHNQVETAQRTLNEISNQTPQLENSANAAASTARTAANTLEDQKNRFQIEQRPYVVLDADRRMEFITQPIAEKKIEVNVWIKNVGRTPAFNVVWNVMLRKYQPGPKTPAGTKKLKSFVTDVFDKLRIQNAIAEKSLAALDKALGAETDIAPNAGQFTTTHDEVILSTEEANIILVRDDVTLFCVGSINYADSLGKTYRTEFCSFYFGPDPKTWHICDHHNTIQ
jgi:hypothetical protein